MGDPSLAAANLAHSWPLLVTILTQYSSNDRVTEKTGRAIKQALQTSRTASAGMLQQVLETVARQFHVTGHPCMLYIASELLKTFGGDAQYQAALGGSHTYWLSCECGFLHKTGLIHVHPYFTLVVMLSIRQPWVGPILTGLNCESVFVHKRSPLMELPLLKPLSFPSPEPLH